MKKCWCKKPQKLLDYTATQHSANQSNAAEKEAHGVDPLNGRKCVQLGTHPYASSPQQPYKKFRGDPPRPAGIRHWFLDRSLSWVHQQKNPLMRAKLNLFS